eukprot:9471840-Pyramimonas_sp.AAC.3
MPLPAPARLSCLIDRVDEVLELPLMDVGVVDVAADAPPLAAALLVVAAVVHDVLTDGLARPLGRLSSAGGGAAAWARPHIISWEPTQRHHGHRMRRDAHDGPA